MNSQALKRHYGFNEYGFSYLPIKMSGRRYYFANFAEEKKGMCCQFCRSSQSMSGRSWKRYRKTQYKENKQWQIFLIQ